jgi:hypothetical protein
VQDVFREGFTSFLMERPVAKRILRAGTAICLCRLGLGTFTAKCPDDHFAKNIERSCYHRSCPMCRFNGTERWVEGWRAKLLDCEYHHVIFTIPDELRPLWRYNEEVLPDILFDAVKVTLKKLMGEEEFCGGVPGVLATLHTWGQQMQLHPHLHCIVTAGGLDGDDWKPAKKKFLLPIALILKFYRGAFLKRLKGRYKRGGIRLPPDMTDQDFFQLVDRLWKKHWHVEIMERYEHANGVLNYLARYVRGGPIANSRIDAFDGDTVAFRYVDNREKKTSAPPTKTMSLPVHDFIGRFLQHVPPPGFRTVRGFGLFANCEVKRKLLKARTALGQDAPEPPRKPSIHRFLAKLGVADRACCPVCGKQLVYVHVIERRRLKARAPPDIPVRENLQP